VAEEQHEAKVIIVDYICDVCKEGKMIPTGMVLSSYPPQYPHVCNKCGSTTNLKETYPTTRFVKVES